MEIIDAREKLLRAALLYVAADMAGPSAYYDAELELRDEMLKDAVDEFVKAHGAVVFKP